MNDYYLRKIDRVRDTDRELYIEVVKDVLGKFLKWRDVELQDIDTLRVLCIRLETGLKFKESPFDITKLSGAIQNGRSGNGISGQAFTEFKCAFCGDTEMWENTSIPNLCRTCATKIAENIILSGENIFKDEE